MKKMFLIIVAIATLFNLSYVNAAEVPFEVSKTKVVASDIDKRQSEVVVVDGVPYNPSGVYKGVDTGYPIPKGEYDHRVKVPITGLKYTFEFWNVGQMGGEKGFFFKSDYGKAKLTIEYQAGQAYKMVGTGKKFGVMEMQEKKEVDTPDIKKFEYDLTFTGGPYGVFNYTQKDGAILRVAHISDGRHITIDTLPEKKTLMREENVSPEITNSSAFKKWLELLEDRYDCENPDDPKIDSGWRFVDYDGEVSVRPCNDEDAWYGADLDLVLHENDHIKNADDSSCSLMSRDMTIFLMNVPNTEIMIRSAKGKTKIQLIAGKIWSNTKRMLKGQTLDIEMSQAVAGIKGTTFVVEDNGQESTLKVIKGHVEFTSKSTGKSDMVGPGEAITANKKGLGKKETFDIAKENKFWENVKQHKYAKEAKTNNQSKGNTGNSVILWGVVLGLLVVGGILFLVGNKNKQTHN